MLAIIAVACCVIVPVVVATVVGLVNLVVVGLVNLVNEAGTRSGDVPFQRRI